MHKEYWQLTVCDHFAAAHALRHYQGKCEALHGHNFGVEMCVEGEKLTEPVQFMVDFGVLKDELKKTLALLDHKCLNDLPEFSSLNPSSENLARFIYQKIKPAIESLDVKLVHVSVSESAKQSARYCEK